MDNRSVKERRTIMKNFIKICKKGQYELKDWLEKLLKAKYKSVVNGDGFLYAKGSDKVPVLLTAHMDTVHKEQCDFVQITREKGETILTSAKGIGGDDRCGIWMIYMILTKTKYRPSILFCEDEEIGGVGSDKFCATKYIDDLKELKYLIELDRANHSDAVYYDCGNEDFKKYIQKTIGYKEAYGSFSDISNLSPDCDKASVNLSCGYYRAHTLQEYVIFEEMFRTFKKVKTLLAEAKTCPSFDYQAETASSNWWNEWDYRYDYKSKVFYEIMYNDKNGKEDVAIIDAGSLEEAFGIFFMENTDRCYMDIIDYAEYGDKYLAM